MSRTRAARKAAVVAAVAGSIAIIAFIAASGHGPLPGPGIADSVKPADETSVDIGITTDDMPAVDDGTGDKKHYVVVASDSPDLEP